MPWQKNFDIEQTLDKAMRTFWTQGFKATSMQDLLGAMEINRGSLYDTYGDKRSLFIAALKRYDRNIRQDHLTLLQSTHSYLDAIRALFDNWIDLALTDSDHAGCFLTNTALELSSHDEEISRIVADSQTGIEQFFLFNVAGAKIHGQLPDHIDPESTAKSLLASLIGMLVLSRSRPEPKLLKTIAGQALANLE